jgi:iron only hydrogenase large subunit-like protein
MSSYTGAATIFGASGGVMEAALRTAYEIATGTTLEQVEFADVRGMSGTKESTVDVGGTAVRVAITNGLGNARRMLERIEADKRAGRASYHFVEIMACAGGCVGGGGQPIENTLAKREQRSAGLYREDRGLPRRKSHENPEVNALYSDFLEKPGSEVAHTLLHTHYARREAYPGLR